MLFCHLGLDKSLILVTISPRHKGHSLSGPEHVEQVQTCPHLKNITSDCLSIQITHSELIPLAKIDCCLELDRPNTGGGSDEAVGGADGAG